MTSVFVGIDLGTTNCSLAVVDYSRKGLPEVVDIPQLVRPGVVENKPQLPSALYIPLSGEKLDPSETLLKLNPEKYCVGALARDRGSETPDRVVLSAKSWLCQSSVDPKTAILPWGSTLHDLKVSAFEASSYYLRYLSEVLIKRDNERDDQRIGEIVLTVPASFDEVARNLTLEAAHKAGLNKVSLLEEPLAAFYSWISKMGDEWRDYLEVGQIVLVCDIGGGTADFSLIYVGEDQGQLSLKRLSVGNHLLLGGDNMDLALAFGLKQKFELAGNSVDHWQFQSLVHQSRKVKERMLKGEDQKLPVTIAGRGSNLFASTLQVEISQSEVIGQILDGFFPIVDIDESLTPAEDLGLSDFGLPYESEPALTKHLGEFLKTSSRNISHLKDLPETVKNKARESVVFPDKVLFNGGVCIPELTRQRILEVISGWAQKEVLELKGTNFNTAVSEGAAYFSQVKSTNKGIRIKAGVPRSYYIGLKSSMPAVPGFKPAIKGMCVVPQGMEEGSSTKLSDQVFSLLTGQKVLFKLFQSKERGEDNFGDVVENAEKDLEESSTLSITLPQNQSVEKSTMSNLQASSRPVPVKLFSRVNDLGMLELWMESTEAKEQWKLEFDVRAEKKTLKSSAIPLSQSKLTMNL